MPNKVILLRAAWPWLNKVPLERLSYDPYWSSQMCAVFPNILYINVIYDRDHYKVHSSASMSQCHTTMSMLADGFYIFNEQSCFKLYKNSMFGFVCPQLSKNFPWATGETILCPFVVLCSTINSGLLSTFIWTCWSSMSSIWSHWLSTNTKRSEKSF